MHHLLVSYLEPQWERRFIYDSYACRQGKGTHKAVERLRAFTRKVTNNQTRRAWYLQLDVRGFFITLNRQILFEQLIAYEYSNLRDFQITRHRKNERHSSGVIQTQSRE